MGEGCVLGDKGVKYRVKDAGVTGRWRERMKIAGVGNGSGGDRERGGVKRGEGEAWGGGECRRIREGKHGRDEIAVYGTERG